MDIYVTLIWVTLFFCIVSKLVSYRIKYGFLKVYKTCCMLGSVNLYSSPSGPQRRVLVGSGEWTKWCRLLSVQWLEVYTDDLPNQESSK